MTILILTVLSYPPKPNIFTKIFQKMEKRSLKFYEVERPFPMVKNKNVLGIMKDELGFVIVKKY